MLIERLMWGTDWNDRLTSLLTDRQPSPVCAACDAPIAADRRDAQNPLLCARCDTADSAA